LDLRKLFGSPADADTQMEYGSSKLDISIRSEYMEQVLEQLRRFGVPADMVTVDIVEAGMSTDGHPVFQAMLRVVAWQRKPAVRLLLGLPLLELNVRKALQRTWLDEVSHFSGLWLQSSSELKATTASTEIRSLIHLLEAGRLEGGDTVPGNLDEGQG
jgi:hypothetical protein